MAPSIDSSAQGNARSLLIWSLDSLLSRDQDSLEPVPNLDHFSEADWTAFSKLVLFEGIAGLVAESLPYQPDSFPAELADAFLTFLDNQRNGNEQRTSAFVEVLKELHSAGISTMPFKGPMLAERTFGDIGLRSFWDFDFLFPKDQIASLNSVLDRLGFENNLPDTPRQQAAYWSYAGQGVYRLEESGLALEPHWAFAPHNLGIDLDYERIWGRSTVSGWRGVEVNLLSQEDEFIMLAIHGGKEAWGKTKYLFDLARFMKQHQDLDWKYIADVARSEGISRMVNLAVTMVSGTFDSCRELGGPLRTSDSVVDKLVGQIQASPETIAPEIYYFNPYFMKIRERWSDKIKYCYRTLLTPRTTHFKILHIPDSLFFLYLPFKVIYDGLILPAWVLWKSITGTKSDQPPS